MASTAPSAREAEFMFRVIEAMEKGPGSLPVDWEQVATKMGLKDASVAKVRFRQIKKKMGMELQGSPTSSGDKADQAVGSGTNTTPSNIKKSRAPRAPKTSDGDTVKTPRTPSKKKVKKQEINEENEYNSDFKPAEDLEMEQNLSSLLGDE